MRVPIVLPAVVLWFSSAGAQVLSKVEPPVLYAQPVASAQTSDADSSRLFLLRGSGNLTITAPSTTETYQVYFHVPIPYGDQAPILIHVESPHLIDYRFIHLSPPNMLIAARLARALKTFVKWEAWVLVRPNAYAGVPATTPIPTPDQIPDSVKPWLAPSDCVQSLDPFVQSMANTVRGSTTSLMDLADDVARHCYGIPPEFPHDPMAWDAYYALKWGSSCTGKAHAGVALLRANGVPARSLHALPATTGSSYDMHWIIEYFVPGYGWVKMETSAGWNPMASENAIVVFVSNLEDEFPLFFPAGLEAYWHTSDPALGLLNPDWGRAHRAETVVQVTADVNLAREAFEITHDVATSHALHWGLLLPPEQRALVERAYELQKESLEWLQAKDLGGYVGRMSQALNAYRQAMLGETETLLWDDFEGPKLGWTHGGKQDEWELGTPTFGAHRCHSGNRCWGTDLDGTYENHADNWLMSPRFDLTGLASAYLSFRVFNWVHDRNYGEVYDPLWLAITTDGVTFSPLCSKMGGVNDDPAIPDVGGWSFMVLDLAPYIGSSSVQIRFRFRSDSENVQPGSFIDDVHVYGRRP